MSCQDKISNTCINYTYANCIKYEGTLGTSSTITSTCPVQKEVNEDLYTIVDNLTANSDTSSLGSSCLSYTLTDNKIILKTVLEVFETTICSNLTKISTLENKTLSDFTITDLNLDFKGLVDPCGTPITTLKQLFQALIDKVQTTP